MKLKFITDIKKSGSSCEEYEGVKYYIDTGNVKFDTIVGKEAYSFVDKPSRANITVNVGDVLFAKMQNSIKVICIDDANKDYIYSTGFYCLKDERVLPEYLKFYFLSKEFNTKKDKLCQGATMKAINDDGMKQIEIDIPSISEQQKIVDIFTRLFAAINEQNEQLDLLNELVKSRFIELFGDPATNEKGWVIHDLENVTTVVTYGLTVRPEYIFEGIDLVSARELHKGYVDYNAAPKISENDFAKLSEKGKPQKNDILFSKTGSIGHCALVTEEKPFAITQNAARIGLKTEAVNPLWLLYYLRMDYIQDWCKDHAKGNAVKDFQLQDMKVIPLFDCPLELQNQFVAFVEQTDKSKLATTETLKYLEELKVKLMHDYFSK